MALTTDNLGVRRETSAQIVSPWQHECTPRLPPGCDARVVVSFGVNDTTVEDGEQRVQTGDTVRYLGEFLSSARTTGWPVLVVGPPPVADEDHTARTVVLDERLRSVAEQRNVP